VEGAARGPAGGAGGAGKKMNKTELLIQKQKQKTVP